MKLSRALLNGLYPVVDGWNYLMSHTLLHIHKDRMELLSMLEKHGFEKKGLYHSVGGTWSLKKEFQLWFDYRVYQESGQFGVPHDIGYSEGGSMSCEEFRKAQKRKMDVLYARRKRQRYQIEVDVLEARAEDFRRKNAAVRSENEHLETLLRDVRLYELSLIQAGGGAQPFSVSRSLLGTGITASQGRAFSIDNISGQRNDLSPSRLALKDDKFPSIVHSVNFKNSEDKRK